jgi:hypothetical protein
MHSTAPHSRLDSLLSGFSLAVLFGGWLAVWLVTP